MCIETGGAFVAPVRFLDLFCFQVVHRSFVTPYLFAGNSSHDYSDLNSLARKNIKTGALRQAHFGYVLSGEPHYPLR